MIGQYLPNNNETATVAFRQKFCQLNSLLAKISSQIILFSHFIKKKAPKKKRSTRILLFYKVK
jgi:hypothetical protein